MLKRFIFAVLLTMLLANVSAYIYVLSPVEKRLQNNTDLPIKYVQPAETIVFQIDRENGFRLWDSAIISVPWKNQLEVLDKTLVLKLEVPRDEPESVRNVTITLLDKESGYKERFNAAIFIKHNLVSASLRENFKECNTNEIIAYELVLVNESLAKHAVRITSSLPKQWFDKLDVELEPKQTKIVKLSVNANAPNSRGISVYIDSLLFDKRFAELDARIRVLPTLLGKFTASYFGLPFFAFNLMPNYLLNALLSLFR